MIYRYLIDGTLIDEPQGWDTLITSIKRDRNLKAVLISQDVTLKFQGSGYTVLKSLFDTGFCQEATLEIQKSCDGKLFTNAYRGLLFTKYFTVDEKRCAISTKVEDNSYFARIFNNKSLECLPHVGFSKNNEVIDVAPLQKIKFFNPVNGTYYSVLSGAGKERSCAGYRVYDIFKFLIDFMSDGTVDFDSTLFGSGGDRAGMMFTTGIVVGTVRAGLSTTGFESNFAKINFEKLLKEVNRICNVGFYVDTTGGRPKIFIEKWDDLFEASNLTTLTSIDELKTSVFQEQLWSQLSIGTSQNLFSYDSASGADYPETIDFLGCKDETFNILGVCNIDSTLDLTGDYVVSHNIIADGVVNQSSSWDADFFFIDCTYVSGITWAAVQGNTLTGVTPPYYYNQAFFNDQITQRYLKHVPNSIAFFLGNNDYKFQATKTDTETRYNPTSLTPFEPVRFQDDSTGTNFDNNGSYDNGGGAFPYQFTVPQSGIYSFYTSIVGSLLTQNISPFTTPSSNVAVFAGIQVYDALGFAGGNLVAQYLVYSDNIVVGTGNITPYQRYGTRTINLTAGQKVLVLANALLVSGIGVLNLTSKIFPGGIFSCTQTKTGGGVYQQYDPKDYSILLHSFRHPVSESEFDAIQNNVKGYLTFSRNSQNPRTGWIEQIKMDHKKGIAEITLNSSVRTNQ